MASRLDVLPRMLMRGLMIAALPVLAFGSLPQIAVAQNIKHHAVSLIGEPKQGPGYKHFDWANPDALKGGRIRFDMTGSFDSLNSFPVQGQTPFGLNYLYEQLFADSHDEPSTGYALIGAWLSYPSDFSSANIGLRPEARFHDGKPITPEDVIYSFETLKVVSKQYSTYYKNVSKVEKVGPHEVKFIFDVTGNRELPSIVAQLPVIPKHWWTANGADGKPRDISKSMTEAPLGSGPYKVKSFELGRTITYERVKDYWAANLPVNKGLWNFDEVVFNYFLDNTAPFESFKIGDVDFRQENSAKNWATEYTFDAVKKDWVKLDKTPVAGVARMQAWVMNTRRPVFQDVRVRRALWLAMDFESANKNLFYGLYTRIKSYFDNSELASSGLPSGRELEILNEVKADLPAEVFTTEWKNPVNNGPEDVRKHLGEASKLLAQAGYTNKGGTLHNAKGQPLAFEILLNDPRFERIALPYKDTLEKLGIKVTIRSLSDSAQYQKRHDDFDFDMIVGGWPRTESPGNEQREFYSSATVNVPGSYNTAGIANKAIDHIVEKIVFAKDRAELVAATRALDRALLWNFYCVPQWHQPAHNIAYWDKFGRPLRSPSREQHGMLTVIESWWIDPAKEAALKAARGK